jgi:plastocyanin
MRKLLSFMLLCFLITFSAVACGSTTKSSSSNTSEVHTSNQSFDQSSITIKKGQTITLINDSSATHFIQNGTWDNDAPKPLQEPGAPTINTQLSGNSQAVIGPFTTSGTFHLYCIPHTGMSLTVIVQ